MGKLTGKIALITGGTEGMGLATAQEFIAKGAFVFITGRRKDKLDQAVATLGPNAFGIQADAGVLADLDRTYAEIEQQKGKLDILFANAGIFPQIPCQQVTEADFDRVYDINVKGVFFSVTKALPLMDSTGSIILNGSFLGSSATSGMSVYASTKAALRSLARTFTVELKGNGPRVNVLSPGPIKTEGFHASVNHNEDVVSFVGNFVPLGRMGTGNEIGRAAVFLASSDSSFVSGTELFVDGGVNSVGASLG